MSQPTTHPDPPAAAPEAADPAWFREPTAREHVIAAALFVGFGLFFAVLFFVLQGRWFRWVVGGLGVVSVLHGLWHAVESRPGRTDAGPAAATDGRPTPPGPHDR